MATETCAISTSVRLSLESSSEKVIFESRRKMWFGQIKWRRDIFRFYISNVVEMYVFQFGSYFYITIFYCFDMIKNDGGSDNNRNRLQKAGHLFNCFNVCLSL